ncbi:MAG: hypothetical protein WA948_06480 [Pontixanthobacter sp.]
MMILAFLFILGMANFAMHRAVIESGHPMLRQIPWLAMKNGRQISFAIEYLVLVAAMLMAAHDVPGIAWGYAIYAAINGLSCWLVLSGRAR